MIPRGLAAAVLATMISQSQLAGSERVSNIVFSVIFFTIIFTSLLVPLLEKSEKFRKIYIKIIYFPNFGGKHGIIDDDFDNDNKDENKDVKDKEDEDKNENEITINDEDDVPKIFI